MDSITKAILDSLRCVNGLNGIVYVTVPITSGIREYKILKELGCSREELRSRYSDRWKSEVITPNEADAEAYAFMTQIQFPNKLVLNPAELRVEDWGQDNYTDMWNQVLTDFCDVLVITPDWSFSAGARGEVQEMVTLGRGVVDLFGRTVTANSLRDEDVAAREKLKTMGWTEDEVLSFLPPLKLPHRSGAVYSTRRFEHAEWNLVAEWILKERRWQRQIDDFKDDDRTRLDGPRNKDGAWRQLLNKYMEKARSAGISTPEGGVALLSYVTISLAMMESVTRIYGPLPEPGVGSGHVRVNRVNSDDISENQMLALMIAWLRREYFYTSQKYDSLEDDENTKLGIGNGSWWDRQLKLYWSKMCEKGLDTPEGRQMLGKHTSTALNLAASWLRLYGPLPTPTRKSAESLLGNI
jgi:hypothetical protein